MAKLVLSALLRPRRDGVHAEVAEYPEVKVKASSVSVAVARLREALWRRIRGTRVASNCSGQPASPVPKTTASEELAVPIEVDVRTKPDA
jgi:hypothetical protein